jgi:hypothetical protein
LTWVAAKALSDAAAAIRDAGDLSALAAQLPLERWFGSDQDHPVTARDASLHPAFHRDQSLTARAS